MRCSEPVTDRSIGLRSLTAIRWVRRCRRRAKVNGMCRQHAAMFRHCQAPACRHRAVRRQKQTGWWLCDDHLPMYETHQRILDRILAIPARD